MTRHPRSAGASESPKPVSRPPSEPARLQRALAQRLSALEHSLDREIALETESGGALEQFVGDVARETRDAGARFWSRLARPRAVALRLVNALTAPSADDDAGVDRGLRDAVSDAVRPMARGWLGLRVRADIPLPQRGAVLIALNRSGWPLPTEAVIVASALAERARRRDVFILWNGDLVTAPAIGAVFRRLGVLPVRRGEARRLLAAGAMVIGFPEGAAAIDKNYAQRYRVASLDDDFLVEEAREAGATLVPGAIVGHEESHPVLARIGGIPLTPTFPFAGVLGLIPLPIGWKVHIGVPLHTDERGGSDVELIAQLRSRMQAMLGEMVSERRSILRG